MENAFRSALPVGFAGPETAKAKLHLDYQKREARRDKLVKRGSLWLNVLMGGALLGHVYADDAFVFPLTRLVPVFVDYHPNGPITWAMTTDQLGPGEHEAGIRSVLWQYLQHREGYAFWGSQVDYDFVANMTVGKARDDYVAWVSKKNPNSYRNILGTDGTIKIDYVDGQFSEKDGQGMYVVQYYRTVSMPGAPSGRQMFSVRITFTDQFVVSAKERTTGNPASVRVIGYSNPIPMEAPHA